MTQSECGLMLDMAIILIPPLYKYAVGDENFMYYSVSVIKIVMWDPFKLI